MSTPRERQRFADSLRKTTAMDELTICYRDFGHLANLIDPTCHAEPVEGNRGVKCSECHTVWSEPDRVRYCPNCGARRTFEESWDSQ